MVSKSSPTTLPIHRAAHRGDLNSVMAELAQGVNIDAPNADGNRPLHLAVAATSLSLVQGLLASGADPNVRNREGLTPLHGAARAGSIEMAQALLGSRAKLDTRGSRHFIIGRYPTPLFVAIEARQMAMAQFLLRQGANPNLSCSAMSETALGLACRWVDAGLVEALLQAGAKPDGIDGRHGEPPHERPLAVAGSGRVARLLLAAGARLDAANVDGQLPQHWLAGAIDRDRPSLAALAVVLRAGADPLARDGNCRSTLQMVRSPTAMRLMRTAITRWLRRHPQVRGAALQQAQQALLSLCDEEGIAVLQAQMELLNMPELNARGRNRNGLTVAELLRHRQLRGGMNADEARTLQRLVARLGQLGQVGRSALPAGG